jgi:hypothetical protein
VGWSVVCKYWWIDELIPHILVSHHCFRKHSLQCLIVSLIKTIWLIKKRHVMNYWTNFIHIAYLWVVRSNKTVPNPQLFHHCIVQFVLELRTVVCRQDTRQSHAHENLHLKKSWKVDDIHTYIHTLYSELATWWASLVGTATASTHFEKWSLSVRMYLQIYW